AACPLLFALCPLPFARSESDNKHPTPCRYRPPPDEQRLFGMAYVKGSCHSSPSCKQLRQTAPDQRDRFHRANDSEHGRQLLPASTASSLPNRFLDRSTLYSARVPHQTGAETHRKRLFQSLARLHSRSYRRLPWRGENNRD